MHVIFLYFYAKYQHICSRKERIIYIMHNFTLTLESEISSMLSGNEFTSSLIHFLMYCYTQLQSELKIYYNRWKNSQHIQGDIYTNIISFYVLTKKEQNCFGSLARLLILVVS